MTTVEDFDKEVANEIVTLGDAGGTRDLQARK